MALRIFSLLVLQAALAWLGHHWRGWPGAAAGVALAGLVLVGIDTWRGRRFMRWAADPQASPQPVGGGLWGEAAYRLRRALRAEQQKAREAAQRLDEFLAAIQASRSSASRSRMQRPTSTVRSSISTCSASCSASSTRSAPC